ncbi:unnamed protein product [Hymenolepis diminuta]|uniref:Uncharacterized protein n=1 Tax=Hymenolepis diminuta TaxID=6216 RepID=A0A564Z5R5_HYMDI|nr:unnamed protein product [Hymenolepis diminuta]
MQDGTNKNHYLSDKDVTSIVIPISNEALSLSVPVFATHRVELNPLIHNTNQPQNANEEPLPMNIFSATLSNDFKLMLQFIHQRNEIDEFGNTPLHYAAETGYKPGIILLLSHHSHVDPINRFGWTPLTAAIINYHLEVAKMLVDAGASPYYFFRNSESPLTAALASV